MLVLVIVVETALNGSFLVNGSQPGLFGGILEAFTFPFVNVGFPFIITLFKIEQLMHIIFFRNSWVFWR